MVVKTRVMMNMMGFRGVWTEGYRELRSEASWDVGCFYVFLQVRYLLAKEMVFLIRYRLQTNEKHLLSPEARLRSTRLVSSLNGDDS